MREANTDEVTELKKENSELKYTVAELTLQNRMLKKVPMTQSKVEEVHEIYSKREV